MTGGLPPVIVAGGKWRLTLMLKSGRVIPSIKEDDFMLKLRVYGYAYYRYYDSGFSACP